MSIATVGPGEKKRAKSLLAEADDALYEAKKSGRNRVIAHVGQPA